MNKIMHSKYFILLAIYFLSTLMISGIYAQFEKNESLVSLKITGLPENLKPGESYKIIIKSHVEDGWHINSNKPNDDFLIPSIIKLNSKALKLVSVEYPPSRNLKFDFSDNPVSVYEGDFEIKTEVKASDVPAGKQEISFVLNYQACNDKTCLPPNSVTEKTNINIADLDKKENDSITTGTGNKTNNQVISPAPQIIQQPATQTASNEFESKGLLLSLVLVFLGGLALNLTPCVYPLIPITVGYFGGQSEGSTSKLFFLGVTYVLGMAITYSIIGVITSLSGALFGTLLQNTYVLIGIALVLIALSLSMFGVYEFKLPNLLVAKAGDARGGLFGALFMGLTMGIVAAPCIGPFVLALVTYVGAKADPYYGFLMFFTLAVGLGFPYIFLALFSGKIKNLPRAGFWMDAVKHIFGFVLLGMALYFILPLLPKNISGYLIPVYSILAGVYLLFWDTSANKEKAFRIFKSVFAIIVIAVSIYLLIPGEKKSPEWKFYSEQEYSASLKSKPIIVDFYADWCIPCKELDALTFSHPEVIKETTRFHNYKVDMTKSLTEENDKLRKKFNIAGMPTVLIINSEGQEVERITGFIKADEFLNRIKSVQ